MFKVFDLFLRKSAKSAGEKKTKLYMNFEK